MAICPYTIIMSARDPQKHNRRSIRLKGYDYSNPGEYFLTICTYNRQCLFGNVVDGAMRLNTAGQMIDKWWNKIPNKFRNTVLDVYIIMPNHSHAIVAITNPNAGADLNNNFDKNNVGADPRICPDTDPRTNPNQYSDPQKDSCPNQGGHVGLPQPGSSYQPCPASISHIIQWFKTMTTNEYIRGVKAGQYPPFNQKVWQRNYYEHIIRKERARERIRDYIIQNPARWHRDRNHPDHR